MSAARKVPIDKVTTRAELMMLTSDINIAAMDARVLLSSVVERLEHFEYRDADKEVIDALYTFTRLIGNAIETIKDRNTSIADVNFGAGGAT